MERSSSHQSQPSSLSFDMSQDSQGSDPSNMQSPSHESSDRPGALPDYEAYHPGHREGNFAPPERMISELTTFDQSSISDYQNQSERSCSERSNIRETSTRQSEQTGDSAIRINANNVSSYNHAFIKNLSESSEVLDAEEEDQVVPLDNVGRGVSSQSLSQEMRQRSNKINTMSTLSRSKSVQEIMESGKRSNAIDLETGKLGGSRSQCAIIREEYERYPQSRRSRGLKKILKFLRKPFRPKDERSARQRVKTKKQRFRDGNRISRRTVSVPSGDDTQYQIFSIDETLGKGMKGINSDRKRKLFGLFNVEKIVTSYLFWAFRSSFLAVLLSALAWFMGITFAFGLALFFLSHRAPKCLYVAGEDFSGNVMDAYSLSWTTFSTVGYGAVYPGTTATAENVNDCWAVTFLSTLESFVGILFASFWGAIFLSKVTRVSSSAQVTFSDPVLIRFGDGVKGTHNNDSESSSSDSDTEGFDHHNYPCPILEFRLINKLAHQRKGEIIDATLNMVASVDASQIPNQSGAGARKKKKGKKGKGRKASVVASFRSHDELDGRPSESEMMRMKQKIRRVLIESNRSGESEGTSNDPAVANRREFAKLFVESQDHPFFKRVWVAKHILDQDSPLLINHAKDLIRLNGGRWPAELNTASAVRSCVKFDQILVSLSGTSNADANTVYAQKIYDFSNVVVGYRFCNILYREVDGSLGVDATLLNDVLEQAGGRAEELDQQLSRFSFRKSKVDILIL